jgi:hypothetical protein
MGAKVSFLTRRLGPNELAREPRLRVPRSAVVRIRGHDAVFVVVGNRVHGESVEVAEPAGDEVTLRSGPSPGTPVVSTPRAHLREGQKVRVVAAGG